MASATHGPDTERPAVRAAVGRGASPLAGHSSVTQLEKLLLIADVGRVVGVVRLAGKDRDEQAETGGAALTWVFPIWVAVVSTVLLIRRDAIQQRSLTPPG